MRPCIWERMARNAAGPAGLEHHLSHCRSCFSRAEMEQALTRRMRASSRSKAPKHLKARLRKPMDQF